MGLDPPAVGGTSLVHGRSCTTASRVTSPRIRLQMDSSSLPWYKSPWAIGSFIAIMGFGAATYNYYQILQARRPPCSVLVCRLAPNGAAAVCNRAPRVWRSAES